MYSKNLRPFKHLRPLNLIRPLTTFVPLSMLLVSCSGNGGSRQGDSDTLGTDGFHADNDIAMVVSSLADAIGMGENLDSTDYAYEGILTDGTGRQLYTDMQGMPGRWTVEVVDTACAVIRNTKIGDLDTDDLQNYVTSALLLEPSDIYIARDFKGRTQSVYTIPGGYLVMTSQNDTTSTGMIGQFVSIMVMK